jgi:perosamine synthetase
MNAANRKRNRILRILCEQCEVNTCVANPPVHTTFPFIAAHTQGQSLPLSEELGERLFCLPIHPRMTEDDNAYICAALWEAVEQARSQ